MITAIDGDLKAKGNPDKFRIKIWDTLNGNTIAYDNQLGASDGTEPVTEIQGGSIVIHQQ